jgi:hypothetical protein
MVPLRGPQPGEGSRCRLASTAVQARMFRADCDNGHCTPAFQYPDKGQGRPHPQQGTHLPGASSTARQLTSCGAGASLGATLPRNPPRPGTSIPVGATNEGVPGRAGAVPSTRVNELQMVPNWRQVEAAVVRPRKQRRMAVPGRSFAIEKSPDAAELQSTTALAGTPAARCGPPARSGCARQSGWHAGSKAFPFAAGRLRWLQYLSSTLTPADGPAT